MLMLIETFYKADYLNSNEAESKKPHLVFQDTNRYN